MLLQSYGPVKKIRQQTFQFVMDSAVSISDSLFGLSSSMLARWLLWIVIGVVAPALVVVLGMDVLRTATPPGPLSVYGFSLFALLAASSFNVIVRSVRGQSFTALVACAAAFAVLLLIEYQQMPLIPTPPVAPLLKPNLGRCFFVEHVHHPGYSL
jgi:hypothetical protein